MSLFCYCDWYAWKTVMINVHDDFIEDDHLFLYYVIPFKLGSCIFNSLFTAISIKNWRAPVFSWKILFIIVGFLIKRKKSDFHNKFMDFDFVSHTKLLSPACCIATNCYALFRFHYALLSSFVTTEFMEKKKKMKCFNEAYENIKTSKNIMNK